jgi:hypothetical protein
MKALDLRAVVVAAIAVVLTLPTTSWGQGPDPVYLEIRRAQELYERVLQKKEDLGLKPAARELRGATGYETAGPYTAPLPGKKRHSFLWGGIDVMEVLKTYDDRIGGDPGKVIFIDRDGEELGNTVHEDLGNEPVAVDVPAFPGQRRRHWPTALFQSQANADEFHERIQDGSLIVAFGLNCAWGIISGPQSGNPRKSHWAQPGLAAITVEKVWDGTKTVTVLSMNLYLRGDDWNAVSVKPQRWTWAGDAFQTLLDSPFTWRDKRERTEMPITQVNTIND